MRTEMQMPQMGESITEATIVRWLKRVGDVVERDESILEISTDKVDSEIPAPVSGKIVEILVPERETVPVETVIAVIDSDEAAQTSTKKETAPSAAAQTAPAPAREAQETPPQKAAALAGAGPKVFSPLVRQLAAQHRLSPEELNSIPGSGTQGRVTKSDVLGFLENRQTPQPTAPSEASVDLPSANLPPPAPRPAFGPDGTMVESFNPMRKRIAEHMVRSKATSAHVYTMAEVDVTAIAAWRKARQNAFSKREGFKLSFTPFFLEAVVKALKQYPRMNASVEGESLVLKQEINLGCAVALGKDGLDGLIVPVIKHADQLSFVGLARALNDLAARVRSKKLSPEEVQGGTFTLTNPGIFGNIMGCPIINQPQLGILGTGAIKKRPVVINDAIAIREMMILTLSYDHRVIDGALAGHFLSYLRTYLEGWNMERSV